jgi:hypothetical protein
MKQSLDTLDGPLTRMGGFVTVNRDPNAASNRLKKTTNTQRNQLVKGLALGLLGMSFFKNAGMNYIMEAIGYSTEGNKK